MTDPISEIPVNIILIEEPKETSVWDYIPDPKNISDAINVPKIFMNLIGENNAWLKKLSNWDTKVRLFVLPSQIKHLLNLDSVKSAEGVSSLSEVVLNISKQTGRVLGKNLPGVVGGALNVGTHAKDAQKLYENRELYEKQIREKISEMSDKIEQLDSTQKAALIGTATMGSVLVGAACVAHPMLPIVIVYKTYQGYKLVGVVDNLYQAVAQSDQKNVVMDTASNLWNKSCERILGSSEEKPAE